MAAPNIAATATLTGATSVTADVGASATSVVSNAAASDKVYKVDTLMVANTTGADVTVTVDFYRSATAYEFVKGVTVPTGAIIDTLTTLLYLEEGDSLRVTSSAATSLDVIASYAIIDDA